MAARAVALVLLILAINAHAEGPQSLEPRTQAIAGRIAATTPSAAPASPASPASAMAAPGAPAAPAAPGDGRGEGATQSEDAGGMHFTNVARAMGVDFVHTFGDSQLDCIVKDTGGGVAWIDYDRDGWPDLFFVSGCTIPGICKANDPKVPRYPQTCRLYHNIGGKRFEDVTAKAGLDQPIYGMGVTVGDYDSDGWPDLYITGYHGNRLYRNRGDGTFEDVTAQAGVALAQKWSTGATFVDYDNDGALDLFVGNYLEYDPKYKFFYAADAYPGPLAYKPQADTLLRSNGDGTFTDVSRKTMIASVAGRTMGVAVCDVNDDGFPDIFAACDGSANFLYINHGGQYFTEEAASQGVALGQGGEGTASMGPDWVDVDGDGHLDLYVPDDKYGALYIYDGASGHFEDQTVRSTIAQATAQFVGWGSGGFDFDNDGIPDLYQANGAINHLQPQEDLLFRGVGDGTFREVSLQCGDYFSQKLQGRGAAFADFDNDGKVDVAVVTLNGPAVLLHNESHNANHWIRLNLLGRRLADPIGAKLWITAGPKRRAFQVRGGSGYLSQSERTVHVGLGAQTKLSQVEIHWPSGLREVHRDLAGDRVWTLVEGRGQVVP